MTRYESYPTTSEECHQDNGCAHEGEFEYVDGKQTKQWVQDHHIISVLKQDGEEFARKTFRVRQGSNQIDAQVLDICSDDDCNNCCSDNSQQTGFLIDMESFTYDAFGASDGIVEWMCLDCGDSSGPTGGTTSSGGSTVTSGPTGGTSPATPTDSSSAAPSTSASPTQGSTNAPSTGASNEN